MHRDSIITTIIWLLIPSIAWIYSQNWRIALIWLVIVTAHMPYQLWQTVRWAWKLTKWVWDACVNGGSWFRPKPDKAGE